MNEYEERLYGVQKKIDEYMKIKQSLEGRLSIFRFILLEFRMVNDGFSRRFRDTLQEFDISRSGILFYDQLLRELYIQESAFIKSIQMYFLDVYRITKFSHAAQA